MMFNPPTSTRKKPRADQLTPPVEQDLPSTASKVGHPRRYQSVQLMRDLVNQYFSKVEQVRKDKGYQEPYLIEGICNELDLTYSELEKYNKLPEFESLIKRAKNKCKFDLIKLALKNKVNSIFAMFYLKNVFRDEFKPDRELTSPEHQEHDVMTAFKALINQAGSKASKPELPSSSKQAG
jgi:hypothetical protein